MRSALAVILVVCGVAGAQDQAGQPETAPGAAPPVLAGPSVAAKTERPTLIEVDVMGRIRELESTPEEAALAMMTLEPEVADEVQGILAARAAVLDRIVMENLELAIQFEAARQAEDRGRQLVLLLEIGRRLEPYRARGPLLAELKGVLPPDDAALLEEMVGEYRRAMVREAVRKAREAGERLTPRQAGVRQGLMETGAELRRSFERQIAASTREFEELLAHLDLRPQQEAAVRRIVLDYAQRTLGKATQEDVRTLLADVARELDPSQRVKLVRYAARRGGRGG